jgi:hypothetical protein
MPKPANACNSLYDNELQRTLAARGKVSGKGSVGNPNRRVGKSDDGPLNCGS